jgi:glucosamine--fructose-6-phosphate aminotransferase (isomerizing)
VWGTVIEVISRHSDALRSLWTNGNYESILLTGCGSTYYLAQAGEALFQELAGVAARAYPASEIALLPQVVFAATSHPLLIAISRSGETTETLEAIRVFQERTGNPVVAVTCASDSSLGTQAELTVGLDEAREQSLAQTRSFTSMLIAVEAIAATFGDRPDLAALSLLPNATANLFNQYGDLARQLGQDPEIEKFFFLGSGALYGIANEAMLKLKEMSLAYSEAFHVLEFRHGPMSMVGRDTLVVAFVSSKIRDQELSVLRHMRQRGARILAVVEYPETLDQDDRTHVVQLPKGIPEWARPVLYLPLMQLMAYYRALLRKQNPDQPANLEFVISLDESMM